MTSPHEASGRCAAEQKGLLRAIWGGRSALAQWAAVVGTSFRFAGETLHVDRTVIFGPTDEVHIRIVSQAVDQVVAGTGGIVYFSGTWQIMGGSGVFVGLSGQGTHVSATVSNANVPPPPQYAQQELVGWVTQ